MEGHRIRELRMAEAISIERQGGSWAIKHNGGYLGHLRSRADALATAAALVDALARDGRDAQLMVEGCGYPARAL